MGPIGSSRGARCALAALVATVAGCFWTVPGQGPDHRAHNPYEDQISTGTVGDLELLWEAPVDDGPVGDPVTSVAGVHVDDTRSVYGFDATTGARLWEQEAAAPLVTEQPVVRGDQVLAGRWNPTATIYGDPTAQDVTLVLDATTGALESQIGDTVVLGLRDKRGVFRGTDYFPVDRPPTPTWAEHLSVRDVTTGQVICCRGFFFTITGGVGPPQSLPSMTLGRRWVFDAGPGINDPDGIPNAPEGNGLRAYSITAPELCLGVVTCPTWIVPTDGTTTTTPVLDEAQATAVVGTDAGTLYSVGADDGVVHWTSSLGSAVTDSPASAGGRLYVPTASGDLVVVDADGCGGVAAGVCDDRLWTASTGSPVTQQPAVVGTGADAVVVTTSADGSIHAFAAEGCGSATCEPLWSTSISSEITGAPAVNGGKLFVGTADGRLLAYGLP